MDHRSGFAQNAIATRRRERGADRFSDWSDSDVATRMKQGDEAAFAELYDRFASGLFSMIYAILRDQKESEDVLQDSFLQMWKRADTYDPNRSLRAPRLISKRNEIGFVSRLPNSTSNSARRSISLSSAASRRHRSPRSSGRRWER
jgi:hypothetical protein